MSTPSSPYPALLRPLDVGDYTIRSRVIMSALTRNRSEKTVPTNLMKEYYLQRAEGGGGLIVTEGTLITRQGTEWPNAPRIWDDKQVEGWKKITDAVHGAGARMYCQLWHVGRTLMRQSKSLLDSPFMHLRPSLREEENSAIFPVYLDTLLPLRILINQFKEAAVNAKKAGFDGVELHGANGYLVGYLVHQLLDSTSNIRTDKWGGSVENRGRFRLDTLKALKEVFGNNVSLKLSPCGGYNDMGMPLQETLDTFSHFISEADKLGLSYICLMCYHPMLDVEFDGKKRATQHDVLASYRPSVKASKLFLNAGVQPEEGEQLVESRKIDGVVMGINWLTHPDLIKRLQHGKRLDNVPDIIHLYGRNDRSDD